MRALLAVIIFLSACDEPVVERVEPPSAAQVEKTRRCSALAEQKIYTDEQYVQCVQRAMAT